MPTKAHDNPIVKYYESRESKWGYSLILKGVKHFGYYPEGSENISMSDAQELMSFEVGKRLGLAKNSLVLDAGCGEGPVSVLLARKFKYRLEGIDLLDFNIAKAVKRANTNNVSDKVHFQTGDYSRLGFPDNHFDGVFMMETLVHAPDYKKVLAEVKRVLKPGGKLVLVEYTKAARKDLTPAQNKIFDQIIRYSSMPSFNHFIHDHFPVILSKAGFNNVEVENISERIAPMTKKLYNIARLPYQVIRLFRAQKHFVNALWGVYHYPYNESGIWRYNIISAKKANPQKPRSNLS